MSLLRRRMMMQTMESGAKYPLVNGRHEFSDGSFVEVLNGNHVLFQKQSSATNMGYVDLSNVLENSDSFSNTGNINFKSRIFTIPAGALAKFEIKNVQGNGNFTCETNFRLAGTSASGSFHTGKFNTQSPEFNTSIEVTLSVAEEVGCLFMYYIGSISQVEFDVEFTVNTERWI